MNRKQNDFGKAKGALNDNGEKDGLWVNHYRGQLIEKGIYREGKKQGWCQ
jgi:hypothetical protein